MNRKSKFSWLFLALAIIALPVAMLWAQTSDPGVVVTLPDGRTIVYHFPATWDAILARWGGILFTVYGVAKFLSKWCGGWLAKSPAGRAVLWIAEHVQLNKPADPPSLTTDKPAPVVAGGGVGIGSTTLPLILAGLLIGGSLFADTPAPVQVAPSPDLTGFLVGAVKFAQTYVATNGVNTVTTGLNMDKRKWTVSPVLGHVLEPVVIGKFGVDQLKLGAGFATDFRPHVNRELIQLEANWHLWKASKIGKVLIFNFEDLSLTAGVGVPVEWLGGKGVRSATLVPQIGGGIHF